MRLGVVGMLPADFREITDQHLAQIAALKLTAGAFHAPGAMLAGVTAAEAHAVRDRFAGAGLALAQFGIGFGECLFGPAQDVRDPLLATIGGGLRVAADLAAGCCLIRTGSLSDRGSYSPDPRNHSPESHQLLVDSLRRVADAAEAAGVTVVVETHLLTIMNSPKKNAAIVGEVGSSHLQVVMDCVNHFQTLYQVYDSPARIDQIFDSMGPISCVGHLKDAKVRDGFVIHIDEEVPGEGDLDLGHLLRRWHQLHPEGYMLLEHLPNEKYPLAASNAHRIAAEAGVEIH